MWKAFVVLGVLAVALFSLEAGAGAKPGRKPASYSQADLDKLWNPSSRKERKLVTSNSFHFWAWSSVKGGHFLGDYLPFGGVVIGDPHPGNVFDYHGDSTALAVADIDDGGLGPFFLDFARYVTYLEASELGIKIGDVYQAYLRGLRGKVDTKPAFLANALRVSAKTMQAEHARWVEKVGGKGKLDYERLGLTPMPGLNHEQKADIASLEPLVLARSGAGKVFDRAYRVNDSGSSAGMSRYWLLVGDDRPRFVYEFKELGRPAVDYYGPQDGHEGRVAAVVEAYSEGFRENELGVVRAGRKTYWMRLRHFQAVDVDDLYEEDLYRFSLYVANWMGQRQGRQPGSAPLLRKLESDAAAKDKLEGFVRAYLAEVVRLKEKFGR